MKIYIQVISISILFILTKSSFAQNAVGYFVKSDSEKVFIYDVGIKTDGEFLYYYNENHKEKRASEKNIILLELGNIKMIGLPYFKNGGWKGLHRIVAYNDSYMLTCYYLKGVKYAFLFDKAHKMLEDRIAYYSGDKPEELFEVVKKYFIGCNELLEKINANIQENAKLPTETGKKKGGVFGGGAFTIAKMDILENINNYKCGQ
ncbi:MAG: secreted protein [Bacteroidota bacterium]|nr:secreted protein [Bacteroidota bacterium]